MKVLTIGKRYSLNDLKTAQLTLRRPKRELVKILIIDDDEFLYKEELRVLGYNIQYLDDVQNLDVVSAYPIIISDIKGVGKYMKMDKGGASLLKELKKKYPFKAYAAYSGSTFDASYNTFLKGVDIIKKGGLPEEWSDNLDYLINKVTNPVDRWCMLRDYLLQHNVGLMEILKMEHEYVDIVLNKGGDFSHFPSSSVQKGLTSDIIKTIGSLAIDLIIKL